MLLKGSTAEHKIQKSTPQVNDAITPPYFEEKHRSDSFDYSLTTPPNFHNCYYVIGKICHLILLTSSMIIPLTSSDKLPSTCKAACFSKDLHAFTSGPRILPQ